MIETVTVPARKLGRKSSRYWIRPRRSNHTGDHVSRHVPEAPPHADEHGRTQGTEETRLQLRKRVAAPAELFEDGPFDQGTRP